MNYTPGEWIVEHQSRRIFIGNGEVSICDITGSQDQEANANLIAAAPEMYEALRQYERMGFFEEYPTYLEGLRNILAKAEGGN